MGLNKLEYEAVSAVQIQLAGGLIYGKLRNADFFGNYPGSV
jgi:hypothetical protein